MQSLHRVLGRRGKWDLVSPSQQGRAQGYNAWCADFAAWAWAQAGVSVPYGDGINADAISFYNRGVDNGLGHLVSSGYTPQPGDVVYYGSLTDAGAAGDHVGHLCQRLERLI